LAIGFVTVFGWNSGQKVWDKYVEPDKTEMYIQQQIDKTYSGKE
jgi:hypothetical protein